MSRRGRGSILAQSDKAKVHEVFAILNLDDHPSGGQEVLTLRLIKLKVKIFDNWIFDAHYPAYCRATAAIFIISRARPRCAMASENDCVVIITIVLTKRDLIEDATTIVHHSAFWFIFNWSWRGHRLHCSALYIYLTI